MTEFPEKKWRRRWTDPFSAIMVCVLCFDVLSGAAETGTAEPTDANAKLRETEMARTAAEQQCAELSLALVRTERELERQRAKSAELLLKCKGLQDELDGLQGRVAPLLLEESKGSSGEAMAAVLAGLEERQAEARRLTTAVRDFGKYLPPILETLPVSEALRREIQGRVTELARACDRLEALPPLVARRGGSEGAPTDCRVLSVNLDLGVVALDAGASAGMRAGTVWQVLDREKPAARIRIIEVRPGISAAQVLEGSVTRLAPGMKVRVVETPGETGGRRNP